MPITVILEDLEVLEGVVVCDDGVVERSGLELCVAARLLGEHRLPANNNNNNNNNNTRESGMPSDCKRQSACDEHAP